MISYREINETYGNLDIYLLDQILKGRFDHCLNILDAGCGEGRNLKYFVNDDRVVVGIDQDPVAIKMAQMTYKEVDPSSFIRADLNQIELPENLFDLTISSAVLHFAQDQANFRQMFLELIRVTKPGGILFVRMATEIGLKDKGLSTFNYLLTPDDLTYISKLCIWLEPFKTVVVDDRSMAVLVLKRD